MRCAGFWSRVDRGGGVISLSASARPQAAMVVNCRRLCAGNCYPKQLRNVPPPPTNDSHSKIMNEQSYEQLKKTLEASGPAAAIDSLCSDLRASKNYAGLFYALLMKKRHELGVAPNPSGPTQEIPPEKHVAYEDAIRDAGRLVGKLFLDEGDISKAWAYYGMLGEPEPVRKAIENLKLAEDLDCQPIIEIALHHGVHPHRGFDMILERYGICSAITTLSGMQFPPDKAELREHCIKRVIRHLHGELTQRLIADITQRQGFAPTATTIPDLVEGRDWLFAEDMYHVDVSHLNAAVQFSMHLEPGAELNMARELCAYGRKLSGRFQFNSDPPFENQYRDYGVYLDILAGVNVEEGLAHFRKKAEDADPEMIGTYPAEVLVNLLLRINRTQEALEVAQKLLRKADTAQLSCPNLYDLCERTKNYQALAELAREQDNPVQYMAGLLAARGAKSR